MKNKKSQLIYEARQLRARLRAKLEKLEKEFFKTKPKQVMKWSALSAKVSEVRQLLEKAEKRLQRREIAVEKLKATDLKDNQFLRCYWNCGNFYFELLEDAFLVPSAADPANLKAMWTENTKTARFFLGNEHTFAGFPKKQAAAFFHSIIRELKNRIESL